MWLSIVSDHLKLVNLLKSHNCSYKVGGTVRRLEKGRMCETKPIYDLTWCALNIDHNIVTVVGGSIRKLEKGRICETQAIFDQAWCAINIGCI